VSQSLLDSKEQVGGQGSAGNEAFAHMLEQIEPDANLLQSRLADTLEVIAEHGPDGKLQKIKLTFKNLNFKFEVKIRIS
jgi:hypothetical protein